MSILFLDEAAMRRAHEVALYASRPEHWYRPGESTWVPGDRPEYVAHFQSFRAVFSYTVAERKLWRHLSISLVHRSGKLPQPVVVFTVASWFGFTGGKLEAEPGERPPPPEFSRVVGEPGEDWQMDVHCHPIPCVVLAQPIGPAGGG